ncbi:MAG TPA: tRNA (adenosine(37)-N6)-threonylcarbamoyltransferase complex dimerization subunit type 1 TsaB [Planctomicrobium sp.]|nr:tRNA (adenosine(37)-N6)-threonylcarbamoyltransferase complex dimerization subunit type 1 TsaB [Planctomicrobium sp.]
MILLGIETSGRAGSVALSIGGALAGERDLTASGRRHARTLVPEIADLLKSVGLTPRDVYAVAVSVGPGSFTGLRVGVVCAKTYAYAVGCRLIGVDTFLAVAQAQNDADRIWVIDDALRGDVFAGEYIRGENGWQCVTPASLQPVETWRGQVSSDHLVTGPGLSSLRNVLVGLNLGEESTGIPHARFVVEIGKKRAEAGDFADLWTLAPFYMRRSAAEEKADALPTSSSRS